MFTGTAADMVCAFTMNYAEEAIGIVRAAREAGIPVAISFTVKADGIPPTGQTLEAAIEQVNEASSGYASYFTVNRTA